MARIKLTDPCVADIADALRFTLQTFGTGERGRLRPSDSLTCRVSHIKPPLAINAAVPADFSQAGLAEPVERLVAPVLMIFGAQELQKSVYQDIVRRLLNRQSL